MATFLYNFFHNRTNSKNENDIVKIPVDKDQWPSSWKEIVYKKYSLLPAVPLGIVTGKLLEILQSRRSSNDCISKNAFSLEKMAYILKCGYGLQNFGQKSDRAENRMVPSAGQLYPLEVYFFLFQDQNELSSGIYHYSVKNNVIEPVILCPFSREEIETFTSKDVTKNALGMICITSVFNRTTSKYGDRGYRFILLEAGHVAQNMLLAGSEKGFNLIPIGGSDDSTIEQHIGLQSKQERVVYTLYF